MNLIYGAIKTITINHKIKATKRQKGVKSLKLLDKNDHISTHILSYNAAYTNTIVVTICSYLKYNLCPFVQIQ